MCRTKAVGSALCEVCDLLECDFVECDLVLFDTASFGVGVAVRRRVVRVVGLAFVVCCFAFVVCCFAFVVRTGFEWVARVRVGLTALAVDL